MALRASISPVVADDEDHSPNSSENQALPPPVVCARTCRTSVEAVEGRTSPTYFITMPCERGAAPIIEAMLITDKSMGKKPSRNQKASSAERLMTSFLAAPCQTLSSSAFQLNPASLGTPPIWLPLCSVIRWPLLDCE